MTKEQLRQECSRLFSCETMIDINELLTVYSSFLFQTIQNHHKNKVLTQSEGDAKLILQMMFTKVLHLKKVIEGIAYNANDGSILGNIIDPTIVASLIRNIYETTGMFNLIYCNTKTDDERQVLYLLWVHSGLNYRQRFVSNVRTAENKAKMAREKIQIDIIVKKIEDTHLFKSLDVRNKDKIRRKLKEKDYLLQFNGTEVSFLHWHDLTEVMGVRKGRLENIYTYFSLYSHPSNVAVFQFGEMFKVGEESFPQLVNFNLNIAFLLFSIFIADYINLFPSVIKIYESINIRDQIVIDFHNILARGQKYSINNSWKALEQ